MRRRGLTRRQAITAAAGVLFLAILTGAIDLDTLITPRQVQASPSQMLLKSIDFGIEYDSNHPLYNKTYLLIDLLVGGGGESLQAVYTLTPQELEEQQPDLRMQSAFDISANIQEEKCLYSLSQSQLKPDIYTYTAIEIPCQNPIPAIRCFQSELQDRCMQSLGNSVFVRSIPTEENSLPGQPHPTYRNSICVMKTRVADFGTISDPTPQVKTEFRLGNGREILTGTVDNLGETRIRLPESGTPKAVIDLVGLTNLGRECPTANDIQAFNYDGTWILIPARSISLYDSAVTQTETYIQSLAGGTADGVNNYLNNAINSVVSDILRQTGLQPPWTEATITGSQATLKLAAPIYFSEIIVKADADYARIYHPVADLQPGTPTTYCFPENEVGKITLPVTNLGEVTGNGQAYIQSCTPGINIQQTTIPLTIPPGQTWYLDLDVTAPEGQGTCTVCVADDIGVECRDIDVCTTGFRECTSGEERCLGASQPQVCVNRFWTNKGRECRPQEICDITENGASCVRQSEVTCSQVCIQNNYASGECVSLMNFQTHLPWLFGKKNLGEAGDCGTLTPPENCLCTPQTGAYPILLGLILASTAFIIGERRLYPGDRTRSILLASLPLLLLFILPHMGVDVIHYENTLKTWAENTLPTPWTPSTTWVLILTAALGAVIGFSLAAADMVPGDELPAAAAGAIALSLTAYAVKGLLTILHLPASVVVAFLTHAHTKKILKKHGIKNKYREQLLILAAATALVIAYLAFWYAVIILIALTLYEAVKQKNRLI